MSTTYQKARWKEYRNKIIGLLNEQPLTFTELIRKSGISRGTVHQHLKALHIEGIIEKEYRDGKILNLLLPSKLDLVEWFLNQLEKLDIPDEVLKKGRVVLNEHVLVLACFVYYQIWNNIYECVESKKIIEGDKITSFSLRLSVSPKVKIVIPDLSKRYRSDKNMYEAIRALIKELNPFSFNIVAILSLQERELDKVIGSEHGLKLHLNVMEKEGFNIPKEVKRDFDRVLKWWVEDVNEYLPSSGLFQLLTVLYLKTMVGNQQVRK